jgi:hypothetical protein
MLTKTIEKLMSRIEDLEPFEPEQEAAGVELAEAPVGD